MCSGPAILTAVSKRSEQKARTRALLKRKAQELLREVPAEALKISHITRAAQVADGTFYVHFPSKAALFDELVSDLDAALRGQLLQALWSHTGTAPERLRKLAETYLQYWRDNYDQYELHLSYFARRKSARLLLTGTQEELHDALVKMLMSAGELELWRVELVVTNLMSLWRTTGLASRQIADIEEEGTIELLCTMTTSLLDQLQPDMLGLLGQRLK